MIVKMYSALPVRYVHREKPVWIAFEYSTALLKSQTGALQRASVSGIGIIIRP